MNPSNLQARNCLLSIVILGLVGCASGGRVVDQWNDESHASQFGRVLALEGADEGSRRAHAVIDALDVVERQARLFVAILVVQHQVPGGRGESTQHYQQQEREPEAGERRQVAQSKRHVQRTSNSAGSMATSLVDCTAR